MSVKILNNHFLAQDKSTQILPNNNSLRKKKQTKVDTKDESYVKLNELLVNSKILFKARTVFPFTFFPDEIIIDKDKISIISKSFFSSDRHQSVLVKNIADCFVDTSIIFGTLNIRDKYFEDNEIAIDYLKKKDAIYARDIICGLIICHEKEVDISEIKKADLLLYLIEIGKATES